MNHSRDVLVTGATGFLGRHLVSELLKNGYSVTALVRRDSDSVPRGAKTLVGDVLDRASLERALKGIGGVFHCAGKVSRRKDAAEELQRLHVQGTRNALEVAKAAGVRRVVVASTSGTVAVTTDPDTVSNEGGDVPIGIISKWPYYRTKLFAEQTALAMQQDGAFDVVSINPSLLLGPGDTHGSSTEDVRTFLEGKLYAIPQGGLSFVDVRDAAVAMRLGYEKGMGGRRYLIGACNITLREFFGRLSRVSGVRAPLVSLPRAPEATRFGAELLERFTDRVGMRLPVDAVSIDMAQHHWYVDSARAERELGFIARDPGETLHDTVADLRARGVVWPQIFESAT
jgi:dihydroflavonol-4-reductase